MSFIKLLYHTIFNYLVKKDGYSTFTHVVASFYLFVALICLLVAILLFLNIILGNVISFHVEKAAVLCGILFAGILNYYFIFNVLNFQKSSTGDDHLFVIETKKYNRAIITLVVIMVGLCILAAINILQHYLREQKMVQ